MTAEHTYQSPFGTRLLTTEEAASALGLSRRTLEDWRLRGCGPRFVRLGGAVRYRPSELSRFVLRGEADSTSAPRRPSARQAVRR
jgi:excisionase family DNA binding protein